MFHRILVAVDGSQHADLALTEAIDLARSEGASLTLIAVGVRPAVFAAPYVTPVPNDDELMDAAQRLVSETAARVPTDVPVAEVARVGRAADEILEQVSAGQHDLVAMGSRGRGAAESLLLGSVSQAVAHHSPVPVLIARAAV